MNHNWEYKRLGEVGAIITGSTPKTSIEEYYNSPDVMFVKPGDIFDTGITNISRTQTYVSKLAYQECCRKLPANSILVTCIGIIGKVGILSEDATCNQQINAIIPYGCNHKYLAYAILSIKSTLDAKRNGPVVPIINKSQFSSFQIPVPPMEVQEQIVAELDQIKDLIAKNRELLSQLDNLAHSLFYDFFGDPISNPKGWETFFIKEFLSLKAGKSIKASELIENSKDGYFPCYGGNGLRGYIAKKSHSGLYNIIGRQGALCGNITLAKGEFYATEHAIVVSPLIDISPQWLNYQFTIMNLNQYAKGVAQPGLSVSVLNELTIPVPPLFLQEKFAKRIEQIDAQKKAIEETITNLQTLLNSRMDYWFN